MTEPLCIFLGTLLLAGLIRWRESRRKGTITLPLRVPEDADLPTGGLMIPSSVRPVHDERLLIAAEALRRISNMGPGEEYEVAVEALEKLAAMGRD